MIALLIYRTDFVERQRKDWKAKIREEENDWNFIQEKGGKTI